MKFYFKIWLLIFLISFFSFNSALSIQTNISDIDESFLIKPNEYITFNFTNTEKTHYFLNQTINTSMPIIVVNKTTGFIDYTYTYQAYIQTFYVNESNFVRFKNEETFYQIRGTEVNFSEDKPDSYQPVVNITMSIRIDQIGKIIVILNNINDFKVTGFFSLKHLIFESDVQVNVPLEPIGDTNNKTTDFSLPFSLLFVIAVFFKQKHKDW